MTFSLRAQSSQSSWASSPAPSLLLSSWAVRRLWPDGLRAEAATRHDPKTYATQRRWEKCATCLVCQFHKGARLMRSIRLRPFSRNPEGMRGQGTRTEGVLNRVAPVCGPAGVAHHVACCPQGSQPAHPFGIAATRSEAAPWVICGYREPPDEPFRGAGRPGRVASLHRDGGVRCRANRAGFLRSREGNDRKRSTLGRRRH